MLVIVRLLPSLVASICEVDEGGNDQPAKEADAVIWNWLPDMLSRSKIYPFVDFRKTYFSP